MHDEMLQLQHGNPNLTHLAIHDANAHQRHAGKPSLRLQQHQPAHAWLSLPSPNAKVKPTTASNRLSFLTQALPYNPLTLPSERLGVFSPHLRRIHIRGTFVVRTA